MVFTLALLIVRRRVAAFIITVGFILPINLFVAKPGGDPLQVGAIGMFCLVSVGVLMRFGVLASMMVTSTSYLLFAMPIGLDISAWYQDAGRICVLLLAGLAVFGFQSALAGRGMLTGDLA